jgi:hypothetical protein
LVQSVNVDVGQSVEEENSQEPRPKPLNINHLLGDVLYSKVCVFPDTSKAQALLPNAVVTKCVFKVAPLVPPESDHSIFKQSQVSPLIHIPLDNLNPSGQPIVSL